MKVLLKGQLVFLCCKSCEEEALTNPDQTLLQFSPDGKKLLVCGAEDGAAWVRDTQTGRGLAELAPGTVVRSCDAAASAAPRRLPSCSPSWPSPPSRPSKTICGSDRSGYR